MKLAGVSIALLVAFGALGTERATADRRGDKARLERIRDLYKKGDYEGVRAELLAQFEESQDPALLFALGQVELNLGHYKAAINYYERFIATSPADDQVALAQQAIGAARLRLTEPEKEPASPPPPIDPVPKEDPSERPEPPPPARTHWTITNTGLVAFGGAAMLVGSGLLYYAHTLGNDHSGTLSDYDSRLGQARTTRLTGAGIGAAGVLIIGLGFAW